MLPLGLSQWYCEDVPRRLRPGYWRRQHLPGRRAPRLAGPHSPEHRFRTRDPPPDSAPSSGFPWHSLPCAAPNYPCLRPDIPEGADSSEPALLPDGQAKEREIQRASASGSEALTPAAAHFLARSRRPSSRSATMTRQPAALSQAAEKAPIRPAPGPLPSRRVSDPRQ